MKEQPTANIKKKIHQGYLVFLDHLLLGISSISILLYQISIDNLGQLPTFEELENPKNF